MIATADRLLAATRTSDSSTLSIAGLVGCYFGLRTCLTFLFFQSEPTAGTAVSLFLNFLILVPVVFYALERNELTWAEARRVGPFRFVLFYLALSFVSLLWSATESPGAALAYWAALASDVLLVLLLLRAERASEATSSLMKGYVFGVALLAVIAWLSPAMQDMRLGDDEFLNPNAIGFECALATFLCHYLAPKETRWKWLGVALAVTMFRSLSKTSIIAFVIAEIFYLIRNRSIGRRTKLAFIACGLTITTAFWNLFAAYYEMYTTDNTGNSAETLTGRVTIWIATWALALEQPWLGHGIHSFRTLVHPFPGFEPWHAHNEFLHQFFVYGLTGVIIVAGLYISFYRQLRKSPGNALVTVSGALLLLVLIRGLADTERFDISFPLWMMTAISLTLAKARQAHAS